MQRFRFGLTIGDPRDRASFLQRVSQAEDAGFDVLAGVDHIGPPLGVMPLLSAVTQVSGLRVSPMVVANDFRHPVLLSKDAATIDVLSDGRFELGIGTGWIRSHYDRAGLAYDPAPVRVDRLEEALAVIKGCWAGKPFTFQGTYYDVDLIGSPVPVQTPHPPILVGGAGRRMLRLAGREADIVGITATLGHEDGKGFFESLSRSGARIDRQIEWVREGAGDRFADIELSMMAHGLVEDASGVEEYASAAGVTAAEVLESPHVLIGPAERIVDSLVERRERFGFSYIVFRDPQFETIAPVVSRLADT